ncbi:No apical meristem-associated C-terminal domain [Fragilaria crotonensis]|nr:No apical meristem-associated C-terminal domain [Fragilaria crotonensis]
MDDVANNKAAGAGRGKGTSNFRVDEDIHLAHAYVFVTTNAAVGTDQDANTFWEKITEIFVRRGGSASRSSVSLKNRFNKVLQFEINKYLGILHGVSFDRTSAVGP